MLSKIRSFIIFNKTLTNPRLPKSHDGKTSLSPFQTIPTCQDVQVESRSHWRQQKRQKRNWMMTTRLGIVDHNHGGFLTIIFRLCMPSRGRNRRSWRRWLPRLQGRDPWVVGVSKNLEKSETRWNNILNYQWKSFRFYNFVLHFLYFEPLIWLDIMWKLK